MNIFISSFVKPRPAARPAGLYGPDELDSMASFTQLRERPTGTAGLWRDLRDEYLAWETRCAVNSKSGSEWKRVRKAHPRMTLARDLNQTRWELLLYYYLL